MRSVAIAALGFWVCQHYFVYLNQHSAAEGTTRVLSKLHLQAESISCDMPFGDSIGVCTFKINRQQFFKSLPKISSTRVLKMRVSAKNVEALKSKVFKGADGVDYLYTFGGSMPNKACEAKSTPQDASEKDLYVILHGQSDLYYVPQTEKGCFSIIFYFN